MFFVLSKIFWVLARPLNFLFLCMVAGALFSRLGWRRFGRGLFAVAALCFALIGFTQLPDLIIHEMETAIPSRMPEGPPAGIIVLGGGLGANNQTTVTGYHLQEASDRMITGIVLKRRFPQARLIYSGGTPALTGGGRPETDAASALAADLFGPDLDIQFESRSLNTWQNAEYTAQLLGEERSRPFLLVTSGFHMRRALGCFRRAGVNVYPVPTDFRADEISPPFLSGDMAGQFLKLNLAVKELFGLLSYRLTGRIDSF